MERGNYQATGYTIPRVNFFEHVQNYVQLSFDFEQEAGLSPEEVAEFAAMAMPLTPKEELDQGLSSPS